MNNVWSRRVIDHVSAASNSLVMSVRRSYPALDFRHDALPDRPGGALPLAVTLLAVVLFYLLFACACLP